MTHKSRFTFEADGVNITPYVENWDVRIGSSVLSNSKGVQFSNPSGAMILENGDGYWTDDRLSAIEEITAKNDGVVISRNKIRKFDIFPDRYTASLGLESINADAYDEPTGFNAATDIDEADVLSAAGVALANRTGFSGYTTRESVEYCAGLHDFLRDFAIYADAHIAEDGDGTFVAVLPATENRTPTVQVLDDTHFIHHAQRRFVKQRGYQRNSQTVKFRKRTEEYQGVIDFGVGTGWRIINTTYWDGGPRGAKIRAYRQSSNSEIRIEFFTSSILDSNDYPDNTFAPVWKAVWWSTRSDGGGPRLRLGGGSEADLLWDGIISAAPGTSERCQIVITKANGSTFSSNDLDTLQMYGLSRIELYLTFDNVWEERGETISVGTGAKMPLRAMPWAIADDDRAKIVTKLERMSTTIPQVTRLLFSATQPSQERWNELLNLPLGESVLLNLQEDGLSVSNRSWALYKGWRYRAKGFSYCEIQFLSWAGNIPPRRIYYGSLDNPVFFGSADNPLFIQIR